MFPRISLGRMILAHGIFLFYKYVSDALDGIYTPIQQYMEQQLNPFKTEEWTRKMRIIMKAPRN
jgi:hypothetical protein